MQIYLLVGDVTSLLAFLQDRKNINKQVKRSLAHRVYNKALERQHPCRYESQMAYCSVGQAAVSEQHLTLMENPALSGLTHRESFNEGFRG